jgi:anti-sigma B factor antagonist
LFTRSLEGPPAPETNREENIMALKLALREVDGVSVVSLDGRLGVGDEANSLRDRVKGLLADGKRKVVLNMDHVALIDSAGLGTLVGLHHSAASCGASLQLCNLNAQLKELLQMTRLLTVFGVSASEADAVRALSRGA